MEVFILKRDGVEVERGDAFALFDHIHKTHSFSWDHALRFEGYSVERASA